MQNSQFSASRIVIELTPEQLEALTTDAARKALEMVKVKTDQWSELPDLVPTTEAAKALNISISTFRRRVKDGLFEPIYTKKNGHPLFDKAELMDFYARIVSE